MLTLAATETLRGVAGSASAITYTVTGDEKTTSNAYKVLAQGQLPSSAGTLYTAPGSTAALIQRIMLANTTAGAVTVSLYINGTAAGNLIVSLSVPANGSAMFTHQGWRVLDASGVPVTTATVTLTGDVTGSGTSTIATTLATVNGNVGTFGTATQVAQVTLNAKGLATAASNVAIQIAESQVTNLVTDLAGKQASGNYITALTTDVTASGPGSVAATIANNAVTNAKAADMATATIKGRTTAGTGDPEDLTASQARGVLGLTHFATDTDLTGDVTTSGSAATTLATVNAGVGSFGSATAVPTFTVNAKGLMTAAGSTSIQIAESQVTNLVTDLAGKQASGNYITALTGDVTATGPGSVAGTLATVNSNVGTFGSASQSVTVTADAKGRITAISQSAISGGGNNFGVVTGNSGTANSDTPGDTLALTGTGNITTAATDTPDGLVVSTTPAATSKISSHYYAFGDFGIVGDWQVVFDGTCSTGSPGIITSATAAFVSGDVGKRITLSNAGASGAKYVGTISSLNSGTSVNVTPNISTTVTNQGMNWGTNNDTAWGAMATAVNALTYAAVVVEFERTVYNRYGLGMLVGFNKPVILQGQGRAYNADTGNYQQVGGTCIAWVGSTSDGGTPFGSALTWVPTGPTNIKGGGLRDCWFDARNGDQAQALTAVKLASVNGFSIREWFVIDALAIAHRFEIDATPTEQESTARGMMSNVGIRMLDNPAGAITTPITTTSAVTLTATGQNLTVAANSFPAAGYGWIMTSIGRPVLFQWTSGGGTTTLAGCRVSAEDAVLAPVTVSGSNVVPAYPGNGCAALLSGNATANTNLSLFQMWQISHGTTWGPAAVEFANADSMVLDSIVINGGNATSLGAINRITKPGVRFNGHDTGVALAARNNVFRDGDAGAGGVSNMALLNTGAKMTAPAGPNYWWGFQLGNGASAPNIELGGYLDWSANGGFCVPGLRNIDTGAGTTYVVGVAKQVPNSAILMPPQAIQVGTTFRWRYLAIKTAAGAAARLHHIRIGTTGTVSDAIVQTFSVTPTAIADGGWIETLFQITVANSASSTGTSGISIYHSPATAGANGLAAATGASAINGTPTVFTSPVSGLWYISLSITTGTAEALTTAFCQSEVVRIGNQGA